MAKSKMKRKHLAQSVTTGSDCGGRCRNSYIHGGKLGAKFQLKSVTEKQLNVNTGAPIPGSVRQLNPLRLPKKVQKLIQDRLNRWTLYKPDDCPKGCFCNPEGLSKVRKEKMTFVSSLIEKRKRTSGWTPKGADNRKGALKKIREGNKTLYDDNTGKPLKVDPNKDELIVTFENCCATIILEIDVMNWFEYSFEVKGKFNLIDEIGHCAPVDGPAKV
ncbi:MAG: hypothetical protein GY814_05785 [Gammaproteobacteria bacterium]|nr:hypothetical protein [Gammaproteobacteria bacterium]